MEYYFFSPEEFKAGIERGDFLEHEEVYPGRYYGTLRSEVDRRIAAGDRVIFDVDCVGGLNIKKGYGHEALSIFIEPPSIEELRRRLVGRSTDSPRGHRGACGEGRSRADLCTALRPRADQR